MTWELFGCTTKNERLRALLLLLGMAMRLIQGQGAHLRAILTTELTPYGLSRVAMKGPDVLLRRLALAMALMIHELATNAAKYGALQLRPRWQSHGHFPTTP